MNKTITILVFMTNTQTKSAYDQITEQAFPGSAGYQLEEGSRPGAVRTLPENSQKPYWSLNPFEPPSEVAEGWHRIKYVDVSGKLLHPSDPRMQAPTVYIDFGLQRQPPGQPDSATSGSSSVSAANLDASKREPLPAHLHPAAESEESLEREVFSQHIERNEYSNFKLRSETRAIESLYGVIQRMTADQQALFQSTLETPRRVTLECKQLIESMSETMRSFHSMIELQSMTMQAIQKQIEMARVPPPPPPPPDYVGLGKTLLEILRDLGLRAIDAGHMRRPLRASRVQELPEIRDAEVSVSTEKQAAESEPSTEVPSAAEGRRDSEDGNPPPASEELRQVLSRLGEIDVARAFASPEGLQELLAGIRKEIDQGRGKAPAENPSAAAQSVASDSSQTPAPGLVKTTPSGKTPRPASIEISRTPSSKTPRIASAHTPNPHGQKRS